MLDPNKHGVYNEESTMRPNWGMIVVLIIGIVFWTNMWFNGFFSSIMWIVISSAIVGIILKLKGQI